MHVFGAQPVLESKEVFWCSWSGDCTANLQKHVFFNTGREEGRNEQASWTPPPPQEKSHKASFFRGTQVGWMGKEGGEKGGWRGGWGRRGGGGGVEEREEGGENGGGQRWKKGAKREGRRGKEGGKEKKKGKRKGEKKKIIIVNPRWGGCAVNPKIVQKSRNNIL